MTKKSVSVSEPNVPVSLLLFTKYKLFAGLLAAVVIFSLFGHYYHARRIGFVFAVLFVFLGAFRLNPNNIRVAGISKFLYALWPAVSLVIICLISLNLVNEKCTYTMGVPNLLLNILIAFILYLIFVFLTGNFTASLFIVSLILLSLSTINGFVYLFRQKEFTASDIFSAKTAFNVIGQYSLFLPMGAACRWVWAGLIVFSQFCLPFSRFENIRVRVLSVLLSTLCVYTVCHTSKNIYTITGWATDGSAQNGFYLNFYLGIRDSFVKAPANYSPQNTVTLCDEYSSCDALDTPEVLPNIIIIMNESFSDMEVFSCDINTSVPMTPFISSLEENTVKGNALVSVFGGSTANSEFEFLTSHSMGFFPNAANAVPYQQFLNSKVYTLTDLVNVLGYDTAATHPYDSTGWSRDRLYPLFGFDNISFIEAYPQTKLIRDLVSDQEMYEQILNSLRSRDTDEPFFLFGVTMQNHGGYLPREDYSAELELTEYGEQFPQAEQYLSLIHESDKAVEYLLSELEDYPEDTVVLFFGDHMPKIEDEYYVLLNGGSLDTLDEQMLKYTVPFFIWANYDIEEYTLEQTSLNYLAGHLLDAAGIELPPYYQFLRDTEEIIPAINAYGYYSKSKGCMIPLDEAEGAEAEALSRYEYVQYNNMFDAKNRNELFFGQYMNAG